LEEGEDKKRTSIPTLLTRENTRSKRKKKPKRYPPKAEEKKRREETKTVKLTTSQ
jgi:hypothetical protein